MVPRRSSHMACEGFDPLSRDSIHPSVMFPTMVVFQYQHKDLSELCVA